MAGVISSPLADVPNGCATPKPPEKSRSRREARGRSSACVPIPDSEKPAILKAYLDNFKREVQTYFPIPAGSPVEAFTELATTYPAFELLSF